MQTIRQSHFDWAVSTSLQQMIQSIPRNHSSSNHNFMCRFCSLLGAFVFIMKLKYFGQSMRCIHSVENLDWLAGSRGHFIQVFSERALVMIPLYLLGPDKEALDIYETFAALQAILIHCNLKFSFGFLKYIFVTPQFHHWHHSSEKPAIDTNYSAHTVVFDWIFRTYHMPKNLWPAELGTTKKLPSTYLGQLAYPITRYINVCSDKK